MLKIVLDRARARVYVNARSASRAVIEIKSLETGDKFGFVFIEMFLGILEGVLP